jgi:hypothetical protein
MGDRSLYDEGILVWSDQQAAALRTLASRRDLPNELDLSNVIEEIEDVGRCEINAATSYVRLILGHVAKGWADPRSRAMRNWAAEVGNWRSELLQHMTPGMRGRIDMDLTWKRALRRADLDLAERGRPEARERIRLSLNHDVCPVPLDELRRDAGEFGDLVAHVAQSALPSPRLR